MGSILGWGTKILDVAWCNQNQTKPIKQKFTKNSGSGSGLELEGSGQISHLAFSLIYNIGIVRFISEVFT